MRPVVQTVLAALLALGPALASASNSSTAADVGLHVADVSIEALAGHDTCEDKTQPCPHCQEAGCEDCAKGGCEDCAKGSCEKCAKAGCPKCAKGSKKAAAGSSCH